MGRTVADAGLLLSAIAERDRDSRRDPMAFPLDASKFLNLEPIAVQSMKNGVTTDFGGLLVSDHVRSEFLNRIEALERGGAQVIHLPIDLSDAVGVDWQLRADVFATQ